MSCYVILKNEYAKAAAVFGAFTEIEKYHEPLLYKYNFEKQRMYNFDDVMDDFMKLYELNYQSVCGSWNLFTIDQDAEIDTKTVLKYKDYIKKMWNYGRHTNINNITTIKNIFFDLYKFFRSVLYQIDNDEMNKQASKIIGTYNGYILDFLSQLDCIESDSWGEFNIDLQ